jgi:hypothetical protein
MRVSRKKLADIGSVRLVGKSVLGWMAANLIIV